jgi:tRNA threonylcarbamoyladenosine biosynthesis protein TsaB
MNLLAFDTSTDTLSIGLGCGPRLWEHTGPGGAQASATLIPALQSLMDQAGLRWAELDAIAFGRGPGSFTGLRTACAVAQGLAFGAGVPVLPIDTLLAVAEEARFLQNGLAADSQSFQVTAMLDARMDEMYVSYYEFNSGSWTQLGGCSLIRPESLVLREGWALAGNVFAAYGERLPGGAAPRLAALPTASAMLRLAPALLAAGHAVAAEAALPIYIRDKVAQTTQERADLVAARKVC